MESIESTDLFTQQTFTKHSWCVQHHTRSRDKRKQETVPTPKELRVWKKTDVYKKK